MFLRAGWVVGNAGLGGVWLIIVRGFAGFSLTDEGVAFKPALPESWDGMHFKLRVRGCQLDVTLHQEGIRIQNLKDSPQELHVKVPGKESWLKPGEVMEG